MRETGSSVGRSAVVVHSPLVGPTTVTALADALAELGWVTSAPDLRAALGDETGPFWQRYVDGAATEPVDIVIGHSGAGAYLPLIADRLGARAVAFVDAVVPDEGSVFRPSQDFSRFLDDRTDERGFLAPWPTWWTPSQLTELLPDRRLRRRVVEDAPRVPRRIYDESVPLPADWWRRPTVYLQLSDAYDEHLERAERYGWPVRRVRGGHLDLAVEPSATAASIERLLAQVVEGQTGIEPA